MSRDEAAVPEDNQDLRGILPSGEGLVPPPYGDLPPGAFTPGESFTSDTHAYLDAIGQSLADVEIAALTNLVEQSTGAANAIADAEATVVGSIDRGLDRVQRTVDSVVQRVTRNINDRMQAAADYLAAVQPAQSAPLEPQLICPVDLPSGLACPPGYAPCRATTGEYLCWDQGTGHVVEPTQLPIEQQPPVTPTSDDRPPPTMPGDTIPPPPGYGDYGRWCSPGYLTNPPTQEQLIQLAIDAGWTGYFDWGQIFRMKQNNNQLRDWNGERIWQGHIMADEQGRCPIGLRPSATGVFFNRCVIQCDTTGVPTPPVQPPAEPPAGEACVPICPPGFERKIPDHKIEDRPLQLPKIPAPHGDDICKAIKEMIDGLGGEKCDFSKVLAFPGISVGGIGVAAAFLDKLLGGGDSVLTKLVGSLARWICKVMDDVSIGPDCDRAKTLAIELPLGILQLINKYTSLAPDPWIQALQNVQNSVCQSRLPDGGMADVAFLRGDITRDEWECYHKAAGDHLQPADKIMQAGRAKLDPTQLDKLRRRKLLDEGVYAKLIREAGVIKDEDRKNIENYNLQFPTHAEIIRLLLRDVFDDKTIDWTESDRIFTQKYVGKAKDWFDANGIPEEMARFFWRAHWHIPSFTMGTQFLHRLRPNDVPEGREFTRDDLKAMLLQDDWHPKWLDAMIDVSYKVPRLVDIRGAYFLYQMNDDDLVRQMQDRGYSEQNALTYLNLWKVQRQIDTARRAGYPTLKQLSRMYATCEITEQQWRDTAVLWVVDTEQMDDAFRAAQLAKDMHTRRRAVQSVKSPFVRGVIDEEEVIGRLQQVGIDPGCISNLIEDWKYQRLRQDRFEAAGQLCKEVEQGIITAAQYVGALINIGYDRDAAFRMAESCEVQVEEKNIRKAEARARRQAADMRRAAREAEKARKLLECGPPGCPMNTPGGQAARVAGPKNQGPLSNGTGATSPPGQ